MVLKHHIFVLTLGSGMAASALSAPAITTPRVDRSNLPMGGERAALAPPENGGPITITHSMTQNIELNNSVACVDVATGFHRENSYFRVFDLADFGIEYDFLVTSVEIGIDAAVSSAGVQPIKVLLYDSGDLSLLPPPAGMDDENVADTQLSFKTFSAVGLIQSGHLTVEVMTPDGLADGNTFFLGSNTDGQTGPSFIRAPECGATTPTDLADLGFPDVHFVINVTGVEFRPKGSFAAPPTPEIMEFTTASALPGQPTPRPVRYAKPGETVRAVVNLENISGMPASGIVATMSPVGPIPGLPWVIANNPVVYRDLCDGCATPGAFDIIVPPMTPPGVHEFELSIISTLGMETIPIWLPVWGMVEHDLDPMTGHGEVDAVSPFLTDALVMTIPEVFDMDGVPIWFDMQAMTVDRVFTESFFGAHWGDAGETELVEPAPPSAPETDMVMVHGTVRTKSGAPIAGATVKLRGTTQPTATGTSDANGQVWFTVPAGSYTRHVDPPIVLRNKYSPGWFNTPANFQRGFVYSYMWEYPDCPQAAGPGTGTASNGGGTPGTAASGGGNGKRSAIVGGGTAVITGALDLLGAPKTLGVTLASLGLSAAAGGLGAYGSDPLLMDIFYFAEELTVPADSTELTLSESVNMTFVVTPPAPGGTDITLESEWTFTRTTDAAVYMAAGSEVLADVPLFLVMEDSTAVMTKSGVVVSTRVSHPDEGLLTGGDILAVAYLGAFDDPVSAGMVILHDDGVAPDETPNDGVFSGDFGPLYVTEGPGGPPRVFFWAQRTGFAEHRIPMLTGLDDVPVSLPCPADLNGDGVVNGADLADLLANWLAPGGPADLNGDGVVNGADLANLLASWGPCS